MERDLPVVDWDRLWTAILTVDNDKSGNRQLYDVIKDIQEQAYDAAVSAISKEGPVRHAMLAAQAEWLDEAANADTQTLRTLATVVADVFRDRADRLRAHERPALDEPTGRHATVPEPPLVDLSEDTDEQPLVPAEPGWEYL